MTDTPTDNPEFSISKDTRARLAELQSRLGHPDDLIDTLLNRGLDVHDIAGELLDSGVGDIGVELAVATMSPNVIGFYYHPEINDETGCIDKQIEDEQRREVAALLQSENIRADVVTRDFEVGIGAQGDLVTLMQFIVLAATTAAAPAVVINQWSTAAPHIRAWFRKRNGRATLEFVKRCCLEDAQRRVGDDEEVGPVEGHAHLVAGDQQAWLTGPYLVSVLALSRSATFVYVTDEVGEILSFQEIPLASTLPE